MLPKRNSQKSEGDSQVEASVLRDQIQSNEIDYIQKALETGLPPLSDVQDPFSNPEKNVASHISLGAQSLPEIRFPDYDFEDGAFSDVGNSSTASGIWSSESMSSKEMLQQESVDLSCPRQSTPSVGDHNSEVGNSSTTSGIWSSESMSLKEMPQQGSSVDLSSSRQSTPSVGHNSEEGNSTSGVCTAESMVERILQEGLLVDSSSSRQSTPSVRHTSEEGNSTSGVCTAESMVKRILQEGLFADSSSSRQSTPSVGEHNSEGGSSTSGVCSSESIPLKGMLQQGSSLDSSSSRGISTPEKFDVLSIPSTPEKFDVPSISTDDALKPEDQTNLMKHDIGSLLDLPGANYIYESESDDEMNEDLDPWEYTQPGISTPEELDMPSTSSSPEKFDVPSFFTDNAPKPEGHISSTRDEIESLLDQTGANYICKFKSDGEINENLEAWEYTMHLDEKEYYFVNAKPIGSEVIEKRNSIPESGPTHPVLLSTSDVKSLLTGMSSKSFLLEGESEIRIIWRPQLQQSEEYLHAATSKLHELCNNYVRIKKFCEAPEICRPHPVVQAMKTALRCYLKMYESTLFSLDVGDYHPVEFFDQLFTKTRCYMKYLSEVCNELDHVYIAEASSKYCGTHILLLLQEILKRDTGIPELFAFFPVFKHCFQVYFRFLEDLLFYGIVNDECIPDFNIIVDDRYSEAEDESFWTHYLTYDEDFHQATAPEFMKKIARPVFQGGKSACLLRRCCYFHPLFKSGPQIVRLGLTEKQIQKIKLQSRYIIIRNIDVILQCLEIQEILLRLKRSGPFSLGGARRSINTTYMRSLLDKQVELEEEIERYHISVSDVENSFVNPTNDLPENSNTVVLDGAEVPLTERILFHKCYDDYSFITMINEKITAYVNETFDNEVFEQMKREEIKSTVEDCIVPLVCQQAKLMDKYMVEFLFSEMDLLELLEEVQTFYFLKDGTFCLSLCQGLKSKVEQLEHWEEIFSLPKLDGILQHALHVSGFSPYMPMLLSIDYYKAEDITLSVDQRVAEGLKLRYKVVFPYNIIITDAHMSIYNNIFILLIQFELALLQLDKAWLHVKNKARSTDAAYSTPEFVIFLAYRHEMREFVHAVHKFVCYNYLDLECNESKKEMRYEAENVEQLRRMHDHFISKSSNVCLLSKPDSCLRQLIQQTLMYVELFSFMGMSSDWKHMDVSSFSHFIKVYKNYEQYSKLLSEALEVLCDKPSIYRYQMYVPMSSFYSAMKPDPGHHH